MLTASLTRVCTNLYRCSNEWNGGLVFFLHNRSRLHKKWLEMSCANKKVELMNFFTTTQWLSYDLTFSSSPFTFVFIVNVLLWLVTQAPIKSSHFSLLTIWLHLSTWKWCAPPLVQPAYHWNSSSGTGNRDGRIASWVTVALSPQTIDPSVVFFHCIWSDFIMSSLWDQIESSRLSTQGKCLILHLFVSFFSTSLCSLNRS